MTGSSSIISNQSLGELLQNSLTSTPCVNVRKDAKVKVVTGMLVQYLETFTDSVVVRDRTKPIGVIGGREIIRGVYKNPSSDFFEMKQIEEITDKRLNVVTADTTVNKLISLWKEVGRAFAVIDMGNDDYSIISVKKLLEIGMNSTSEFHISEIPKKKIITCGKDATFGEIMKLMLETKLPDSGLKFNHKDQLLTIGSCFSDNIGEKLTSDGFEVLKNPLGILFDPAFSCFDDRAWSERCSSTC